jgi:asparagine synthase (glutamine-hydrolysing)
MCGIFGAVGYTLPDSAVERVFDHLHHRGPDGKGLFTDGAAQVTLAHTRLAVIDLQTGDQPLYSNDGNLVLVANGEIYGFERIRSELEAKGHRFQTKSDSEVIIHLYEEYGLGCFEHLRGEFAFLLYDKAKQLLIAGRDRFGIKPLYFSRLRHGFVFASEMKAIFASGLVAPKLNVAALDPLLDGSTLRFPFEAIEHLPPAHYALIDLETLESRIQPYWSPEIPASTADPVPESYGDAPEEAARCVLRELEEAVRLRLRADVPVGLYLSGGLDSTFVAALMKRNMTSELHSFSISFEGSEKNEREFTLQASREIGTHHHDFSVTKQMLWDNLEDCVWHTELPFVSLAPVGKFLLSEEAKKFVTVALNGQGADEVFLGYKAFFRNALRDTRSPDPKRRNISVRQRRLHVTGIPVPLMEKLSLLLFRKDRRPALQVARANGAEAAEDSSRPLINRVQESRVAEMPIDILGFLGDRVEMAHSLEIRVPFLDHKLYDTAKWIPDDFKMRDGVEKAVLRDAGKGIIPEDLRMRRKQGFMITSDPIDLFGRDRESTESLRAHLSKQAFDAAEVFSWRTFRFLSLLARVPSWVPFSFPKRLRREANKVLMYIMQVHMLHRMFVVEPRWAKPPPRPVEKAEPEHATIAA